MIRPRLPRVAGDTRLTTDLINGIIDRTEYAADLLRQYKLTAGNGMYIEPHYDGTRISYLQPVAGGATPVIPVGLPYTVVGNAIINGKQIGFIFKNENYEFIDYPNSTITSFADIEKSKIVGNATVNGQQVGFLYANGIFTNIKRGNLPTILTGISGSNICGYADHGLGITKGFIYDGTSFTDISYPGATGTYINGIENKTLCGYAFFSIGGIFKGFIYDGTSFTDISYPGATQIFANDIDNNNVLLTINIPVNGVGFYRVFIYDGINFKEISFNNKSISAQKIKNQYITILKSDLTNEGYIYDGKAFKSLLPTGATSSIARGIDIN